LFGTDGVRGRAGEGWLSAERVSALGRAVGRVLIGANPSADSPRSSKPRALLGHDGRRSGPTLEAALARGLAAAGITPVSAGLTTTPGLAHLTRAGDFAVGVMVSASHNPADDNGIKIFGSSGEKLDDGIEDAIEAAWRAAPDAVHGATPLQHDASLEALYVQHLVAAAGGLSLRGVELGLDAANGGASRVGPAVLEALGARVHTLGCAPDGDNINSGCGSTHPEALAELVRARGLMLGVALDGDGDRCVLVDEHGAVVDGDALLTLLAAWRVANGGLPGGRIVATVMSNRGLHRALADLGLSVVTVDVGDRRVVEGLRREALVLGGEQSGHIVFGPDNHFIGDGVLTALRVIEALIGTGRPLSELAARFCAFPQVLVNVPVRVKPPWSELPAVLAMVAEVERELGLDGRVLLRYSGTESLARVMVEGPHSGAIEAHARRIADGIQIAIGA